MDTLFLLHLLFLVFVRGYFCYKPVVFIHGLFGSRYDADNVFRWIKEFHRGTKMYSVDLYEKAESMTAMVKQQIDVNAAVEQYMQKHPEGIHLIGHSQGGLLCRSILQETKHSVDTFISLATPLAGQFGMPSLDVFFPNLTRDEVYRVAYTKIAQEDLSVANYWNDPRHQDLYRKFNTYLAVLNNDTFNPKAEEWRANFLRLKKVVLVGGPDDEVITPWQSSHFGFFDENLDVVNMTQMPFYKHDTFGLQTMVKRNDVYIYTQDKVYHNNWINRKDVFEKYILPHLT